MKKIYISIMIASTVVLFGGCSSDTIIDLLDLEYRSCEFNGQCHTIYEDKESDAMAACEAIVRENTGSTTAYNVSLESCD